MSAADLSHPSLSMEYTPLDPQTSVAETKLNDEIPKDNGPTPGAVDYIGRRHHGDDIW